MNEKIYDMMDEALERADNKFEKVFERLVVSEIFDNRIIPGEVRERLRKEPLLHDGNFVINLATINLHV